MASVISVLGTTNRGVAEWSLGSGLTRLQLSSGESNPDIGWDQGTLQFAPDLNGPWIDLPAASPMQLSPIGEKGFFRVKVVE